MAPVACQNSFRVNGNRRNKLTSRISQSVASTVWLGLRPKLGAPHPWTPPTLGRPVSYIFSSRRLRNLSLIYLLALATTEQPPSCRRCVIQTPPSSDIKIARLRFLFILRLRTGIDLRDQADLASARLVTIGSWLSDCIGASSLARRSRIVRVNNHQIGFISTHRKIGHSPSIRTHQDVHPSKSLLRVAPVRPVKSTGQTGVAWAARDEQHPRVNSPKSKPRSPESLHGLEEDFGDIRNTS
jgi:hypothetical protein